MKNICLIIVILLLLGGCRTEYIPVKTISTEYKDREYQIRISDSVNNERIVLINGDTVYIREYADRWHTRIMHDSIYIQKTDTITIPYPVKETVEVERNRSWWETLLLSVAGIIVIFSIIMLLFCYFKRVTKSCTH